MKQVIKWIWISVFLIGLSNSLSASNYLKTDSIKISQVVNGFYDWYLTSIQQKKYLFFNPIFIEAVNGMTTLDYTQYLENLKTHGFSELLINKEKQSYLGCIENLGKVKYSDFQKTIFTDLDEYEQTNCDFGNYYRWTGGQEPIDGIRIKTIEILSNEEAVVSIDYYEFDSTKNIKHYWGRNTLTMKKIKDNWLIENIDSFEL
jgi:hypothetical protein